MSSEAGTSITRGMLRSRADLVNGSRGYVVDIVWHADVTDPRTTLPAYILIYFPKYTGPALPYDIPSVPMPSKVVPIFPCRRYLDLKARDTPRALGLLYVALSRVRRLEHLAIFADITLEDIRPNVTRALELRRQDEANRAPQVMLPPLGPPMPRTRDLLTSRSLTFSTDENERGVDENERGVDENERG
ncbi:hypothetical protein E4U52_006597, partial [Claviceps spartinae]